MNNIIFSDKFIFNDFSFTKYHHTDNRKGITHNFLAYMVKGHAEIVTDRKTMQINEGDVFYLPKNLSYQSYWHGDEIRFLSFGFLDLNTNDAADFELQIVPCSSETAHKIIAIPTKHNVDCKALSLFYEVMSEVVPMLKRSENREKSIVEQIKACIRKNPYLTLPEIADLCSISEPYMYALFKKNTDITPNDYRQKVLCDKAICLLITTDKKIEEISRMTNFSSSSYFRKILKKHTGMTPGEIRKSRTF